MGSKSDARSAETVEEVADLWLSTHVQAKRSEGTHEHYRDLLDRIIKPALGKLKAKSLTHAKVKKLHDDWSHTPFQANRILACISAFYNWAGSASVALVPKGHNPADDVEKFEEPGRERPLEPDELLRLADAFRLAETTDIPWDIDPAKLSSKHLAAPEKRVTVFGPHVVAAMDAATDMTSRLYGQIIIRMAFDFKDFALKARAVQVMAEATGGAVFENPSELDTAVMRQVIEWLADHSDGGGS